MGSDLIFQISLGLGLLLLVVVLSGWGPEPNPTLERVYRILAAAGAGYLVYGITGTIVIDGEYLGFTIRASLGFAVFILTFLYNPPGRIARKRRAKGT